MINRSILQVRYYG